MQKADIPTSIHYPVPMNEQSAYKHLSRGDLTPVAKKMAGMVMSLPMSPDIDPKSLREVVTALRLARTATTDTIVGKI